MALKNIIITGSIGTYPTLSYGQKTYISSTDQQSFPIEQATGSNGGSLPNLGGQTSSVDLFTPIVQKWSGFNNTPVGLVAYTHSIQDEFINGEFSGSAYVVTDGTLNDPQCDQFLKINTTQTPYRIFYYQAQTNQIPLDSFLDGNTSPNSGEMYFYDPGYFSGTTVNTDYFLKINKYDTTGADNTLSLQELTIIRAVYSDIGIVDIYPFTINEYPTYYLYKIAVPPFGPPFWSLADFNVLNYAFSASANTSFPLSIPAGTGGFIPFPGFASVTNYNLSYDILGGFNPLTGVYSSPNTSNIPLAITASFIASNPVGAGSLNLSLTLFDTSPNQYPSILISNFTILTGAAQSFTLTAESQIREGAQYVATFGNFSSTGPASISNFQLKFNNLIDAFHPYNAPKIATTPTVLEPYLTSNFYYSDCNALFGNQDGLEYDVDYMSVNYDNGSVIPSNQQQILNNTAERAPVKPYNYSANAQVLPRYNGVRVTQQNPNVWTLGDVAPDKSPSVKVSITYFAYFDKVVNTSAILKDKAGFSIKYLIDEKGNIYNPSTDDATYYNLIDSFEPGKKAYATLLSNQNIIYNNTQSILLSGQYYSPILYSLSSSIAQGWTSQIDFVNQDGSSGSGVTNFNSTVNWVNELNVYNVGAGTKYGLDTFGGNSGFKNAGDWRFNTTVSSISNTINNFLFSSTGQSPVTVQIYGNLYNGNSNGFQVYVEIHKNGVRVNPFNIHTAEPDSTGYYAASYTFTPQLNDYITFYITKATGLSDYSNIIYPPTVIITTSNLIIPTVTAPFWTTGSNNSTSITSSANLAFAYQQYVQKPIPQSNIGNTEVFQIKVGDEFRFEYQEGPSSVFRVTNAILSGSSPARVYVTFDKPIPSVPSLNIDHFTIRRPVKSLGAGVILDSPFVSNVSGGFLFPEFPSDGILKNLSSIVNNLSEKNIIQ